MQNRLNVVVLYFENDPEPLPDALYDRLFCWGRFQDVNPVFINLAYSYSSETLSKFAPDAFFLDTTLLRRRWTDELMADTLSRLESVKMTDSFVAAMPHDECTCSDALNAILEAASCDHVFSCADPADQDVIYPRPRNFSISKILASYISPRLRAIASKSTTSMKCRPVFLSYRTATGYVSLGWAGWIKRQIGEQFQRACKQRGLACDIELGREDWIAGKHWIRMLRQSRAVLGAESGATVLNHDGKLQGHLNNMQSSNVLPLFFEHPESLFSGQYQALSLLTLSARHLEAACTCTPQVLIEGDYNGHLIPDKHYLAVRRDLSNVDEIIDSLHDTDRLIELAQRCQDYVLSTRALDEKAYCQTVMNKLPVRKASKSLRTAGWILSCNHWIQRRRLSIHRSVRRVKMHFD